MSTAVIRDRIIGAVVARLGTVAGATVERMPSGDPDNDRTLVIDDRGQQVREREHQYTRYGLELGIEGYVTGSGGTAAHERLSELYADAVTALLADPYLGGLSELIEEGDLRVDVAKLNDKPFLGFSLDITIQFISRAHNPSLQ